MPFPSDTDPDTQVEDLIVREAERQITGIQLKIIAWVGSGGVGFMRICRNMVMPINSGQMPIIRNEGGVKGIRPNRLKMVVGSGADRSWIQPIHGAWRSSIDPSRIL